VEEIDLVLAVLRQKDRDANSEVLEEISLELYELPNRKKDSASDAPTAMSPTVANMMPKLARWRTGNIEMLNAVQEDPSQTQAAPSSTNNNNNNSNSSNTQHAPNSNNRDQLSLAYLDNSKRVDVHAKKVAEQPSAPVHPSSTSSTPVTTASSSTPVVSENNPRPTVANKKRKVKVIDLQSNAVSVKKFCVKNMKKKEHSLKKKEQKEQQRYVLYFVVVFSHSLESPLGSLVRKWTLMVILQFKCLVSCLQHLGHTTFRAVSMMTFSM
jgi:hypothetical protein